MTRSRPVRTLVSAVVVLVVGVVVAVALLGNSLLPGTPGPTSLVSTPRPAVTPANAAEATGSPRLQETVPTPAPTVYAITNPDGPKPSEPTDQEGLIGAAHALPGYAGIWVDHNQRDYHIAVASDVPGAITTIRPLIPAGVTVYFHEFAHTHAELEAVMTRITADRDALLEMGVWTSGFWIDIKHNSVGVGVDPLEPEIESIFRERYGDFIVLEHSPKPPPIPAEWPTEPEVVHAVVRADRPVLLTCGSGAFQADALNGPAGAEDKTGPIYDALREGLRIFAGEFPDSVNLSWILVHQDDTDAIFLAERGDGWQSAHVALEDGEWYMSGFGGCQPRTYIGEGVGFAEWALDPDFPKPTAQSREIHALIREQDCSGGIPAFGRIAEPVAEYGNGELVLTIGVQTIGGTCPGNPTTPVTIVLPEPLGNRDLLDGSYYPPGSPSLEP